jgi:hypothetical protein
LCHAEIVTYGAWPIRPKDLFASLSDARETIETLRLLGFAVVSAGY